MQLPLPPPSAERTARKYFLPALGFLHLLLFSVFRFGVLRDAATGWTTSAFVTAGFLLFRDLATSRRENRVPDVLSQVAWGAAALLELHALSPGVSSSRLVPAVLFPAFSFLLPALPAGVYAIASLAWLVWSPYAGFAGGETFSSIAAMAALGTVTGRYVRTRLGPGTEGILSRKPVGPGASLVVSPEKPDENGGTENHGSWKGEDLLAMREVELEEGIQRVLEGIFPIAGADRILYVSSSHRKGSPLVVRHVTPPEKGGPPFFPEIPETYVPLREAMIFRRVFFAEGEESSRWGFSSDGRLEQPSGVAAVPVICEGMEEGGILAFRFGEGRWTEPVAPVLEMGAFFIAREIVGTRRGYRNDRFLERQIGFSRLAKTIAEAAEKVGEDGTESASPRRVVYKTAAEQIRLQLRADRVLLVEADVRKMRGRVAWETTQEKEEEATYGGQEESPWVKLAGTYAEWVLKNNVHRIFSGIRTLPGKHPILPGKWEREDEDAFLLVPVAGAGGFRGILVCTSREDRSYQKRDAEMVREVLTIMRMGISHALQIETLEERATSDGLTGLLNQKTFRQRLTNVLSRLDTRYEGAVIMADIDHFKRVNDTYGHPAGDEVLRKTAKIVQKTIRKADMAARYGGEEFVIYLHHADRAKAVQVAERLRLVIEQTRFDFGGKDIGVTASMGIACYPSDGRESRELLAHADEALYRSKQEGRNRTTLYREPS
jgi:diguanylate cyclase (GGDEF)-like protein